MATTTHRLPTELKERVAEARQDFVDEADARYREMMDTGLGIAWEEFRTHLIELSEGRPSRTPRKHAWRK